MSQTPDWNTPTPYPATPQPYDPQYGQPQYDQPQYGQTPTGQDYQQPQVQAGYPGAPYQQPLAPGYGAQVAQVVPKNAGVALLISFFVPGVGSMYAGKTTTGVIILIGYLISWALTLVIIGILGLFVFWVWGMIDAYQAAQSWNRARGLVS